MSFINAILSTLLAFGLVAAALGYRHSLMRREYSPEWYFSAGKVIIALAFGLRLLWWDVAWNILRHYDRETAYRISEAIGGTNSNIVFICMGFVGCYCSLKARHLLLTPEEQRRWHWLVAWAHPEILGLDLSRLVPRRR